MAWIQMRTNLWTDGRVKRIQALTNSNAAVTVGALYRLWSVADEHTTDGDLPGWTPKQLDLEVGLPGFASALQDEQVQWLEVTEQGLYIVKFEEHNGTSAKARLKNAQRQKASRIRNATVTVPPLPKEEKRREENISNTPVSFPPPLDAELCGAAWEEWLEHKRSRGEKYKSTKTPLVTCQRYFIEL